MSLSHATCLEMALSLLQTRLRTRSFSAITTLLPQGRFTLPQRNAGALAGSLPPLKDSVIVGKGVDAAVVHVAAGRVVAVSIIALSFPVADGGPRAKRRPPPPERAAILSIYSMASGLRVAFFYRTVRTRFDDWLQPYTKMR